MARSAALRWERTGDRSQAPRDEVTSPADLAAAGGGAVASQERLEAVAAAEHRRCLVCGADNVQGLKLRFRVEDDGSVAADFRCRQVFQSYSETLHGGVTSALLDAAMTNALFSVGVVGVTAELRVRFLAPVALGRGAVVRAAIEEDVHPLFYLRGEVEQDRELMARAWGKFVVKDDR